MKILFILIFIFFVGGCSVKDNSKISNEEYLIYGIVIDSLFNSESDISIVVTDSTVYYEDSITAIDKNGNETKTCPILGFKRIYPTIWKSIDTLELCDNYNLLNKRKYHLNPRMINCSHNLIYIPSDSLKRIFSMPIKNNWAYFRDMFANPRGIFQVSRVAFNHKMTEAIVYTDHMEDYVSGEGVNYLLVKVYGKWEIKCKLRIWAS